MVEGREIGTHEVGQDDLGKHSEYAGDDVEGANEGTGGLPVSRGDLRVKEGGTQVADGLFGSDNGADGRKMAGNVAREARRRGL